MKTTLRIGLCLITTGCLLGFTGCKKKEEPVKPAAPAAANAAKPATPAATNVTKPAAEVKVEAPKAISAPAAEVKTEAANATTAPAAATETIPIADVQAEASKMTVEQLKAKAMEYKDLIVAKKAMIEPLAAKLKAIPLTEQMGTEAKGLQTEISTLSKSVSALTERFNIYYNKLKMMGGDVSSLQL